MTTAFGTVTGGSGISPYLGSDPGSGAAALAVLNLLPAADGSLPTVAQVAATAVTSATTCTATLTSVPTAGDLLLAVVSYNPARKLTPPAGFTQLVNAVIPTGLWIGARVAGASDSKDTKATFSAANAGQVTVLETTATGVDRWITAAATDSPYTLPLLSATVDNTLGVAAVSTTAAFAPTAPTGWTAEEVGTGTAYPNSVLVTTDPVPKQTAASVNVLIDGSNTSVPATPAGTYQPVYGDRVLTLNVGRQLVAIPLAVAPDTMQHQVTGSVLSVQGQIDIAIAEADQAAIDAAAATTLANQAQTSADGRHEIFYDDTAHEPTVRTDGSPLVVGDTWFVEDTRTYTTSGGTVVTEPLTVSQDTWNGTGWDVKPAASEILAYLDASIITVGLLKGIVIKADWLETAIDVGIGTSDGHGGYVPGSVIPGVLATSSNVHPDGGSVPAEVGTEGGLFIYNSDGPVLVFDTATGDLTLTGGLLTAPTIQGATIIGSVFETATSGKRVVIDSAFNDRVAYLLGWTAEDAGMVQSGIVGGATPTDSAQGALVILPPAKTGTAKIAEILLQNGSYDGTHPSAMQLTAQTVFINGGPLSALNLGGGNVSSVGGIGMSGSITMTSGNITDPNSHPYARWAGGTTQRYHDAGQASLTTASHGSPAVPGSIQIPHNLGHTPIAAVMAIRTTSDGTAHEWKHMSGLDDAFSIYFAIKDSSGAAVANGVGVDVDYVAYG